MLASARDLLLLASQERQLALAARAYPLLVAECEGAALGYEFRARELQKDVDDRKEKR